MRISPQDLQTQFIRARNDWAFVGEINDRYGFPPALLYAVGSRETNLRNVVGDGGHGHGVFQLDDRFHIIPAGFDTDVRAQAEMAAAMLAALFSRFEDWIKACNSYNSGSPATNATAGHDYGPDVMARQQFLSTLNSGGDMPNPADLWNYVLPDPYIAPDGTKAQPKSAADLLGWAATHAAYAKEQAIAARTEVAALHTAIAALAAVVTADPDITPEEFKAILDAELGKVVTVRVSVDGPPPVKP